MQESLSRIISSMILNIMQIKDAPTDAYDVAALAKSTEDGLNALATSWPNLTEEEK